MPDDYLQGRADGRLTHIVSLAIAFLVTIEMDGACSVCSHSLPARFDGMAAGRLIARVPLGKVTLPHFAGLIRCSHALVSAREERKQVFELKESSSMYFYCFMTIQRGAHTARVSVAS